MKTEIAEMQKSINCLALELPESIHKDVVRRWEKLKAALPGANRAVPVTAKPCTGCVLGNKDGEPINTMHPDCFYCRRWTNDNFKPRMAEPSTP